MHILTLRQRREYCSTLMMNGNTTNEKLLLLLDISIVQSPVLWHGGIILLRSQEITSGSNNI